MTEPTTIHWLTLPRNGNGGAALVTWRRNLDESEAIPCTGYLLGDKPPRYPVPATRLNTGPAWLDFWWARNMVLYRVDL